MSGEPPHKQNPVEEIAEVKQYGAWHREKEREEILPPSYFILEQKWMPHMYNTRLGKTLHPTRALAHPRGNRSGCFFLALRIKNFSAIAFPVQRDSHIAIFCHVIRIPRPHIFKR